MVTIYACFLLVSAFAFLATPIVYTFLRLSNKIGPKDNDDAGWVGFGLWLAGLIGFFVCINYIFSTILP